MSRKVNGNLKKKVKCILQIFSSIESGSALYYRDQHYFLLQRIGRQAIFVGFDLMEGYHIYRLESILLNNFRVLYIHIDPHF